MKKTVLVCGATGFIGRNIVEAFAGRDDFDVVAVYNRQPPFDCPGVRWTKADLTKAEDVDRCVAGADVIVQAAATTSGVKDIVNRPHVHVTDNAVMNSLLFRAAHDRKVGHVVFFSCTVMHQSGETPLTEDDFDANRELHPRYFGVGWTKIYIEKMCEFFSRVGETRFTAIRHTNVYGPHDKFDLERSHVFGATVTKAMTATDGAMTIWGTGEEERDLLYIDDLTDFVARVIDRQETPFELYNCGYGRAIAINALVEKIVEASGRDLRIEHDLSMPTIKTSLSLDCTKAERELGWKVKTSLDEGVALTVEWWKQNISADRRHDRQASSG